MLNDKMQAKCRAKWSLFQEGLQGSLNVRVSQTHGQSWVRKCWMRESEKRWPSGGAQDLGAASTEAIGRYKKSALGCVVITRVGAPYTETVEALHACESPLFRT